ADAVPRGDVGPIAGRIDDKRRIDGCRDDSRRGTGCDPSGVRLHSRDVQTAVPVGVVARDRGGLAACGAVVAGNDPLKRDLGHVLLVEPRITAYVMDMPLAWGAKR